MVSIISCCGLFAAADSCRWIVPDGPVTPSHYHLMLGSLAMHRRLDRARCGRAQPGCACISCDHQSFLLMLPLTCSFINASRGEVVDQDALVRILSERPGMRAGLDVTSPEPLPTNHPLLSLDNCVVLPHIGSASDACRMAMAEMTVRNALAVLDGSELPAEVPETKPASK